MKWYIKSNMNNDIESQLSQSKIRRRNGGLIVCYHGTNAQFDEFKEDFISSNSGNIGWFGKGFYFTDSEKLAKSYGIITRKCYLDIRKPFLYSSPGSLWRLIELGVTDYRSDNLRLVPYAYLDDPTPIENFTKAIRDAGYDGVVFHYRQGGYKPNIRGASNATEYVCFSPSQVYFID